MESLRVVAEIVGPILTLVIGYFLGGRSKSRRDDFQVITDRQTKEIERKDQQIQKAQSEKSEAEQERDQALKIANEFKTSLLLLESSNDDRPVPYWIKDVDGQMLFVNDFYEQHFLKPKGFTKFDYIGKFDVDIWGEKIAENFRKHDLFAMENGYWIGGEIVQIQNEDISKDWLFLKYARKVGNKVIGTAGMGIPVNPKPSPLIAT